MQRKGISEFLKQNQDVWDEIRRKTDARKTIVQDKYKLGRKIVQVRDSYGTKKGRVGWVSSVWPKTRVVFEDGMEPDVHSDFCVCLEATDEYHDGDVELLAQELRMNASKKRSRGKKNER